MRKSKSIPSRYTRNYRSISQRQMTTFDDLDEDVEMERLRGMLRDSQHLEAEPPKQKKRRKKEKNAATSIEETSDNVPSESMSKPAAPILSDELMADLGGGEDMIIASTKKKKKKTPTIELTAQELRQAKLLQKKTQKKLKQLEQRKEQKRKRAELYQKLHDSAITKQEMELLSSSSTLGKKLTKRDLLKQALQKERAGIELTEDEKDLLYKDRDVDKQKEEYVKANESIKPAKEVPQTKEDTQKDEVNDSAESTTREPKASSFASQMMASLSQLKTQSLQMSLDAERKRKEEEAAALEKIEEPTTKPYVPVETAILKSAAKLGISPTATKSVRSVQKIDRPKDIKATRYDLPVSQMEFEVMDTVRNNDVTILCGETGSGKSTQIPQFLYEGGSTMIPDTNDHSLIGITQPRRVAAVSTAKRVSYEMGQSSGQRINGGPNGEGSLVAYQTRYETAGLGTSTHIKFMTDGILLQEIQSDLLLRKYSVIVLDEAHERNLNTDVLIGLLSAALPLRRQAAAEPGSSVRPLKIVVMSATLRVEDFTKNERLFPSISPAVLKVPGRTYPVTIHHSKKTELDKYEDTAFRMVKKIHKKLPAGGILVFLTGRQEIVRMVRRLRQSLNPKEPQSSPDVHDITPEADTAETPRDLDDDDADADVFHDESDDIESDSEAQDDIEIPLEGHSQESNVERALVLPLYSLLSVDEQAKVFRPPPEGHRLIVVATNIAETSITIPGISYVVDTGRQKCRNYHSGTGVASYDIMWISKAAADQRAGRAGRTGPGHCYRLYSSSLYSRQMDEFALPEVLTRPLEDVVLAMKGMNISNVRSFPFATPPADEQLNAAIELLGNIGCVDLTDVERSGGDGTVTRLGAAVARLPLGVRCGKMLLVAAQAGVLDYAIAMVAALSESNPFVTHGQTDESFPDEKSDGESDSEDEAKPRKRVTKKWKYEKGGDVLAVMLAVGAYSYAGRGAGGHSEKIACRKFCEENGLHPVIMSRIQKMRRHLSKLAQARFSGASGVAPRTGGFDDKMKPPNQLQENLLRQAIGSALLDNVGILAPLGSISGDHPYSLRSAYIGCSHSSREPLFIDRNSVVFSRDSRRLPQWICYESLLRKTLKDGTPVSVMKNVTPIDPAWLGFLAKGSTLIRLEDPVPAPLPIYDAEKDCVMCSVRTKYGRHGWEVPPARQNMMMALSRSKKTTNFGEDDAFKWFARYLLEGSIFPELKELTPLLNEPAVAITSRRPLAKVATLVSLLKEADIDSATALRSYWKNENKTFLFRELKAWLPREHWKQAQKIWVRMVEVVVASGGAD